MYDKRKEYQDNIPFYLNSRCDEKYRDNAQYCYQDNKIIIISCFIVFIHRVVEGIYEMKYIKTAGIN